MIIITAPSILILCYMTPLFTRAFGVNCSKEKGTKEVQVQETKVVVTAHKVLIRAWIMNKQSSISILEN